MATRPKNPFEKPADDLSPDVDPRATQKRLARILAKMALLLLWAYSVYLVVYYAALWWLGAERLYVLFGQRLYNILIPSGGFRPLLLISSYSIIWAIPFAAFLLLTLTALHVSLPRIRKGRRLILMICIPLLLTILLQLVLLDGWPNTVLPLLFGDDTDYAKGYSSLAFRRIHRGMNESDVVSKLGRPISQHITSANPQEKILRWSQSPHSGNYRVRELLMRDGVVVEKRAEFYWD